MNILNMQPSSDRLTVTLLVRHANRQFTIVLTTNPSQEEILLECTTPLAGRVRLVCPIDLSAAEAIPLLCDTVLMAEGQLMTVQTVQ